MELNRFAHIPAGKFRSGLEIECCIKRNLNPAFEKAIQRLDKRIEFEYDGSLRPIGWSHDYHNENVYFQRAKYNHLPCDQAHELLTPVLPTKEALELVQEIFKLIERDGYTNQSCGLHANFSPVNRKDYDKINPFYLASQKIWKRLKEDFKRERNRFCKDVVLRRDIIENPQRILNSVKHGKFWDKFDGIERTTDYKHKNPISLWQYMTKMQENGRFDKQKLVNYAWHYSVVNFDHYTPDPQPDSRIEIRGFGNTNYHLRIEEIAQYIDEILYLFEQSMKHPIYISEVNGVKKY